MLKPPPSYLLRETTQVVWRIARHLRVTWMNRWKIRSLNDSRVMKTAALFANEHMQPKFQRRWWKLCDWNINDSWLYFLLLYWDMNMPFTTILQHHSSAASYLPTSPPEAQQGNWDSQTPARKQRCKRRGFWPSSTSTGREGKDGHHQWLTIETSFRIREFQPKNFHLPLLLGGGAVDPSTVFLLYVQINDSSRAIWMFVLSMKFQWIFENPGLHPSVLRAQMLMEKYHTSLILSTTCPVCLIYLRKTLVHSKGKSQIFDTLQKAKGIKYDCSCVRTISLENPTMFHRSMSYLKKNTFQHHGFRTRFWCFETVIATYPASP